MTNKKTVKIVDFIGREVWIEDDLTGNKHIMIQYQDGESDPFCYCTFHYDYRYTSNAIIQKVAEELAMALGASQPVECKTRPM